MARPRTGSIRYHRGAWRIQASLGTDPATGKRRYRTTTVHAPDTKAGERTARQALARLLLEVEAGIHQPVARGTLAELIDQWITTRAPEWPEGADDHTRSVLDLHVIPTLGSRQLETLRTADIDRLYGKLRAAGLKPGTVRRIHSYLHAALNQAVRWQLIPVNPSANANKPTVPRQAPKALPTPAQLRTALAKASPWLTVAARIAVHTGARRGEIARLRWDQVDDESPAGMAITFHQTKTDTYKTVPVGPATTTLLRAWRRTVREQALAAGMPSAAEWLFPSWRSDGGPHIRPDAITQAWDRLRRKHGLEHVKFHDLRHTMASQLIGGGHDVRTVADRGGWSSPTVLLGTYAHAVDAAALRAAQAMDDWLDGTA